MPNTVTITKPSTTMENQALVPIPSYTQQDGLNDLDRYQDSYQTEIAKLSFVKKFGQVSTATGGYVQLLPQYHYLPALIGNDSQPVYLYEIVEVIDEFLDYDKIQEEYPTLSFSQIAGAVSFLRKIAQLNVDVDEMEDRRDAEDSELIDALRACLEIQKR